MEDVASAGELLFDRFFHNDLRPGLRRCRHFLQHFRRYLRFLLLHDLRHIFRKYLRRYPLLHVLQPCA